MGSLPQKEWRPAQTGAFPTHCGDKRYALGYPRFMSLLWKGRYVGGKPPWLQGKDCPLSQPSSPVSGEVSAKTYTGKIFDKWGIRPIGWLEENRAQRGRKTGERKSKSLRFRKFGLAELVLGAHSALQERGGRVIMELLNSISLFS
jgi:hypothetical protein